MARPMSDAELEAKFRGLADHGAPTLDAGRLIESIWGIDREPNVARIIKMTALSAG
jgi:hypothetical protein